MVGEGIVLFRVKDFEKCRRGVAPEVHTYLVHLIEHEYRVAGTCLPYPLDDPSWKCPHVSTPVPPDLCLVPYSTKGDADELSPQCPCNRSSEGCLSSTRGSHKAEDGPLHVFLELSHCKEFEDPLLDLFEVIMVLVENPLGPLDIEVVFCPDAPWKLYQPVEVGPGNCIFSRCRRHLG